MFILDMIFDIFYEVYHSLGYGTPQRKINIKVEKVSKYHSDIMELYVNNKHVFEEDPILSKTILHANIKKDEGKRELAEKIIAFFAKTDKV